MNLSSFTLMSVQSCTIDFLVQNTKEELFNHILSWKIVVHMINAYDFLHNVH